ncbi:hypothetical protein [Pseudomonas putida]
MKWKKLGLCFSPTGENEWMQTHAAVPIAEHLHDDIFRVYFSSRDSTNRSFTGFVVIDLKHPTQPLEVSATPVLAPGAMGEFDDSGAMATWLAQKDETRYLYYIGWNLGRTVPFRNSIGIASSSNGNSFQRLFDGPIVDRSAVEPHFCASCCVLPDGAIWRMWYLSCTGWHTNAAGQPEHAYHIKYAESADGLSWQREGHVAIDYESEDEYAISRPSVIRDVDGWKMWYSFRGDAYRIGYAESQDGRNWQRMDNRAGISVSENGWDSEMIEYPFVFDHGGERYMLYNGNDYGRSGFGLAVLERTA